MAKTEHFQEKLNDEHRRLVRILGWVQTEALEDDASVQESAPGSGDNEFADSATELYTQEFDSALQERFKDRLRAVDGALQRIQTGQYGHCMRCGQDIPEARLEAMPETPFCVACAGEEEVQG